VVALTGAGMSKESGLATFREQQTGLWARFDPSELATEAAFRRHPARVFGWYLWRWRTVRMSQPHAGYRAMVRLASHFDAFTVVTQNVDGLHRRAGAADVFELHGSIDAFKCLEQWHPYDAQELVHLIVGEVGEVDPPECPSCGSPIRPGVVWFGESLPHDAIKGAWAATEQCDVMLVIGTSSVVYPAAELPHLARAHGAAVVEINPQRTPLTPLADASCVLSAAEALPGLADVFESPVPS
jgi:NAD-dependent deacetylase